MKLWLWIQALGFQVIWFLAVVGKNARLIFPFSILILQLYLSPRTKDDLKILPLALLGIFLDLSFTKLGLFVFDSFPWWLITLWLSFVLNFGHSLIFLRNLKLYWQSILGAAGGCYAYLLSWKLDAVDLPMGAIISGSIIAVAWACILPLMIRSDRFMRERNKCT